MSGSVTPRGRTPIGDKGLGRLGSQRLARNVEIITCSKNNPFREHYLAFSWADFKSTANLGSVGLTYQADRIPERSPGTKLVLSDLREPEMWQSEEHLRELQRKLAGLISPFQEQRDFQVLLEVDGKKLELAEITRRVRETAILRYEFSFDGSVLTISGAARRSYLEPSKKADKELLETLFRRDHGSALYEYLSEKNTRGKPTHLSLSDKKGWFLEFGIERTLEDLDGVKRDKGVAVNPGDFRGEVDSVSLENPDSDFGLAGRQSEYRQLVRELAGIRVYRDGFGIRVGEDWLNLGRQWTGGSSYYGLRPGNVLGYVAISARNNPGLEETTSREGFQVTPHYENFYGLLREFVVFAGSVQEFLRRGILGFLKDCRERNVGIDPADSYSQVTQRIGTIAERLAAEQKNVQRGISSLKRVRSESARNLQQVGKELQPNLFQSDRASVAVENLQRELEDVTQDAEMTLKEVSNALKQASELESTNKVLDRRWNMLNEHVSALHESISLGLTAEALSHEINNIADRLARRSTRLLRQLKGDVKRSLVIEYIEHVRSSVATMRKQLSHLAPSLRYLRETKARIDVCIWVEEFAKFHNETLSSNRIRVVVEMHSASFFINMNEGKLTQVFDNLLLNSNYWLKESQLAHTIERGEILIVLEEPFVRVSDNGKGIDDLVEESLFEPFVTTKRRGEGRGLGLFVVRELLDSESCGILLLQDRNDRGKRYIFELDLSGALSE